MAKEEVSAGVGHVLFAAKITACASSNYIAHASSAWKTSPVSRQMERASYSPPN